MHGSVYLDPAEELLMHQLAEANELRPNQILRLGLRHLATLADPEGRLPIIGRPYQAPSGPQTAA